MDLTKIEASGNVNGMVIINGKLMHPGRALDLLRRADAAMHRLSHENGETHFEVCDEISGFLTNLFGHEWREATHHAGVSDS